VARELSELLTDLSQQAKKVEDAFAAIADETDTAAEARRERTRTAAKEAAERLDQSAVAMSDTLSGHWRALQTRIDEEITGVQEGIAARKHERDVSEAEGQAEAARERAMRAVAFASAAVETAGLAVVDAAIARKDAEAIKRQ
jgi:hypothetical protein